MPKKKTQEPVQSGDSTCGLTRKEFRQTTSEPVQAGDFARILPEFGRTPDATRTFGLKRGTLYNLYADGKIAGCVVRSRGQKSGCRLWDMESIRRYIRHCHTQEAA